MKRTSGRPIPSGRVTANEAYAFGVVLSIFSVLLIGLAANGLSAALLAFTILFYALVYTVWLKRSTPQNIVIGGAAGALPPMIGYAIVTNTITVDSFILFAIIFVWTPPHFWAWHCSSPKIMPKPAFRCCPMSRARLGPASRSCSIRWSSHHLAWRPGSQDSAAGLRRRCCPKRRGMLHLAVRCYRVRTGRKPTRPPGSSSASRSCTCSCCLLSYWRNTACRWRRGSGW